jgi:hypothetical protein
MERVIFHKKSEFNKFDWNALVPNDYKTGGDNYTFGRGGSGYPGGEGWHISVYDEKEINEHVWELPDAISVFIDWAEENGKREKTKEIKRALGLK